MTTNKPADPVIVANVLHGTIRHLAHNIRQLREHAEGAARRRDKDMIINMGERAKAHEAVIEMLKKLAKEVESNDKHAR